MSSISDTLVPPDPSKSAFLEFGGHGYPGHQQPSPGLSHNHYPVHGLHAVGPSQHDGPFSSGASSYGRPLGYPPYHSPVSAHHPGAYLPYQHGGHGGALGHTRLEDAGRFTQDKYGTLMFALFFCIHSLSSIFIPRVKSGKISEKENRGFSLIEAWLICFLLGPPALK